MFAASDAPSGASATSGCTRSVKAGAPRVVRTIEAPSRATCALAAKVSVPAAICRPANPWSAGTSSVEWIHTEPVGRVQSRRSFVSGVDSAGMKSRTRSGATNERTTTRMSAGSSNAVKRRRRPVELKNGPCTVVGRSVGSPDGVASGRTSSTICRRRPSALSRAASAAPNSSASSTSPGQGPDQPEIREAVNDSRKRHLRPAAQNDDRVMVSIHPEAEIRLAASRTVPAVLLDGERRVKGSHGS